MNDLSSKLKNRIVKIEQHGMDRVIDLIDNMAAIPVDTLSKLSLIKKNFLITFKGNLLTQGLDNWVDALIETQYLYGYFGDGRWDFIVTEGGQYFPVIHEGDVHMALSSRIYDIIHSFGVKGLPIFRLALNFGSSSEPIQNIYDRPELYININESTLQDKAFAVTVKVEGKSSTVSINLRGDIIIERGTYQEFLDNTRFITLN